MERHIKMQLLISNTSQRFAALSPTKELLEMPYYFTSSYFYFWEGEAMVLCQQR
jgi:hypothetical protein